MCAIQINDDDDDDDDDDDIADRQIAVRNLKQYSSLIEINEI